MNKPKGDSDSAKKTFQPHQILLNCDISIYINLKATLEMSYINIFKAQAYS